MDYSTHVRTGRVSRPVSQALTSPIIRRLSSVDSARTPRLEVKDRNNNNQLVHLYCVLVLIVYDSLSPLLLYLPAAGHQVTRLDTTEVYSM